MNIKLTVILCWTILAVFGFARGETIKQEPIIIKTPVSNYDQPNFDDYKACMKALDSCTNSCGNVEECLSKCIKCPMLVKQDIVVQGVNDTDFKTLTSYQPLNSTNIIRVTNEIHNMIENNLGDIHSKNENNINIYEQKSLACDKYGLGCNGNGTCCYIVRNRQREKQCGKHCQARVMLEKTVVQCTDETNLNSCKKIIEYKPLRSKSTKHVTRDNYRCRYDIKWPFVACRNRKEINERCSSICLSLSYLYILQHGVPLHCISCYKSFGESPKDYTAPLLKDDTFDSRDMEWILEKTKCRLEDGSISENCVKGKTEVNHDNELGSGDGGNYFENPSLASFNALDTTHNEFRRSKYSLRHRRNHIKRENEQIFI